MDCNEIKENLSAYLDKALSQEELSKIESHLATCQACRDEYQALSQTVKALSSMDELIPPAQFRRELRRKLQKEAASKKMGMLQGFFRRFSRIPRSTFIPVATALVLLLVMVPFLGNQAPFFKAQKAEDSSEAMPQSSYDYDRSGESGKLKLKGDEFTANALSAGAPQGSYSMEQEQNAGVRSAAPLDGAGISADPGFTERKIIKNAELTVLVDEYKTAVQAIKDKVVLLNGYVANESANSTDDGSITNGYLQVRIPQEIFESFLSMMDEVGRVKDKNVYTQDVSEEYVDLDSRLKALRTKEERLLSILSVSGKLSDVLAVENELANTRAQLESIQGRLRYLDNRTEMSSIAINIRQNPSSTKQVTTTGISGVLERAKEALISSVNAIIGGIGKAVVYISSALPYLVLLALCGLGVWKWVRRRGQ